jgi:hypothetical protein
LLGLSVSTVTALESKIVSVSMCVGVAITDPVTRMRKMRIDKYAPACTARPPGEEQLIHTSS